MLTRRDLIRGAAGAVALSSVAMLSGKVCAAAVTDYENEFDRSRTRRKGRPDITERPEFIVEKYGAVADGKTLNTAALQKAIDEASSHPEGGRVTLSRGSYLTGALVLKSNVHIFVEKGATLLGSVSIYDYESPGGILPLLHCSKAENVAVSGEGVIDGRGRELALNINYLHHSGQRKLDPFNYRRNRAHGEDRPMLFGFHECTDIQVYDVELRNSACWGQKYSLCENIDIDNIKVHSDAFWNNDGIDLDDSRSVRISNSFLNTADDAIVLKSMNGSSRVNEDIEITDCVLRSSSNAIKFGTESQGGFKNITVKNVRVYDTYRSAIALETVDGAHIENIQVDGVEANNVGCAIFVRRGSRNRDVPENTPVGRAKNITIRNVRAEIAFGRADADYDLRGPALNDFFNPIPSSITGLPDNPVEDITLENIEISYPGRANQGMAYIPTDQLFLVPEKREEYPEYTMFGELPCWGLFCRHVNNIRVKNIRLIAREHDFRPAFIFDDVHSLRLEKTKLKAKEQARQQVVLNDVQGAKLPGFSNDAMLVTGKSSDIS